MAKQFPIRLDDETRKLLEQGAEAEGLSLTDFIRSAAIKRAKTVVKDEKAEAR